MLRSGIAYVYRTETPIRASSARFLARNYTFGQVPAPA